MDLGRTRKRSVVIPQQLLTPFSMPVDGASESLFDTVICADGIARARIFLERNNAAIGRASQGLVDYLEAWLGGPTSEQMARTIWDIGFGQVGLSLKDHRVDVLETAARVALRIAESGHAGQWRAAIEPSPIIIGRYLVEDVEAIDFTGSQGGASELKLTCANRADVVFNGCSHSWTSKVAEPLRSATPVARALLLPSRALPRGDGFAFFAECCSVATVDDMAEHTFRDSFAALRLAAPDYLTWVDRVLNGLIVSCLQPNYRAVSGSWQEVPGYLHSSYPHGAFEVAEILVHECAHQYFYMLERLGPFDDGSDPTLYWSPVVGTRRPLSRVLMAYHALANVLRLYRKVRDCGIDDAGYVEANMADLIENVRVLAQPLRNNPALTELGRGLYEPLSEQVDA